MRGALPFDLGSDPFGLAVALSAVAGVLSTRVDFLSGLVAALVALALATWASRRGRLRAAAPLTWPELLGLGAIAAAAAVWVVGDGPWSEVRGALLGLSVAPLYLVDRRGRRARPGARG